MATQIISFRTHKDTRQKLDAEAKALGISLSDHLRNIFSKIYPAESQESIRDSKSH